MEIIAEEWHSDKLMGHKLLEVVTGLVNYQSRLRAKQ